MNKPKPDLPKIPAPLIRAEQCQKCKFSSALPQQKTLECRRYPPHPEHIAQQGPNGQIGFITYTGYPQVKPDHWCGCFKPHIEGIN